LTTARRVNAGLYRLVRLGNGASNGLKIRCPLTKSAALPNGKHRSIKGPISVPVSPLNAVECYPCRKVPLNYNRSLLFHGGDTGSTPVRDAHYFNHLQDITISPRVQGGLVHSVEIFEIGLDDVVMSAICSLSFSIRTASVAPNSLSLIMTVRPDDISTTMRSGR
jgi:hypothetical protein